MEDYACVIDDQAHYLFTNGECGTLAAVMSQRIGDAMVILTRNTYPVHVVVKMGNGLFADIEGVHTMAELYERWAFDSAAPWLEGEDEIDEAVDAFYERQAGQRPDWESADQIAPAVEAMWSERVAA